MTTATTSVKTICCYCGTGCGIEIRRDARGAVSLRGDEGHPTNRGMLCSKGKTLLHAALSRSTRLTSPQLRLELDQPLSKTTWDGALGHIAGRIAQIRSVHGPDSVAFYCSGQMLTEEYYLVNKLVKGFLQTNNLDTNSRLCMSSAVMGYKLTLGADSPPISYDDIESCDTFLVAGANPAWAHPILWRRVEARRQTDPDVRIIVVDPRRTASCALADLHLQINPGSDVVLHLGLTRQLLATGAVDEDFVREHCDGWDALRERIQPYTPAEVALRCGLRPQDIIQAAAWLSGPRRFLSMWTMGLNQSAMGVDKNVTLINLSLVTGKIGRPGCGPFSLTGQPNAMGGREVGGMATLASAHRDLSNPEHRREIAAHWGVPEVPNRPGLTAIEMFQAVRAGTVKAIWIVATNPVESLPQSWEIEAALRAAELVVVQEIFPTATTAFAHVILPAATWLEKTGTMTNSERRISLLSSALEPPGECLPDSRIFCEFARHMGWGDSFRYTDQAAVFAEHVGLTRGRDCDISGLSHARLTQGSLQWPVTDMQHPGTPRLFGNGSFQTPNRRARLQAPEPTNRSEPLSPSYPLVLTTGRLRDQWHTMTRTGTVAKLRDHAPAPFCEIHPHDASDRGIKDQDVMSLSGERGAVQLLAKVTTDIKTGVVFLPMHWGKLLAGDLGRTNNLTSPRLDPVSREPDLKFAAVQASRYQPPLRRIIIIGGGAGARAFVEAHRGHGSLDPITIFGEEPEPIYNRVLLPHVVSGHTRFREMVTATAEQLLEQQVVFHAGLGISVIDRQRREVVDARGGRHSYDLLVLATGSRAARHFQGRLPAGGVHSLRRLPDALAIRTEGGPGRRVVVVGGGVLGLELADALRHLGSEVTILQRSDRLMGRQLDAAAAAHLARAITARGIAVRFRTDLEEVLGVTTVSGLVLKGGEQLACDLLIFATGTVPNAELARSAVLRCSTGVIVDEHLRTSDPHIHAIGEVAEFEGLSAGTTAAVEVQARHLAEYLRGNLHAPYRGPANANVLKVEGVQLVSMGEAEAGPGMSQVVLEDTEQGIYQKCVIKDDRLVGLILFGDTSLFADYRELITGGIELEEKRRSLLRPSAEIRSVDGALICSCNQIGDATIRRCIRESRGSSQPCTLAAVCASTRAGTSCGSCRPEVALIIEKELAGIPRGSP